MTDEKEKANALVKIPPLKYSESSVNASSSGVADKLELAAFTVMKTEKVDEDDNIEDESESLKLVYDDEDSHVPKFNDISP